MAAVLAEEKWLKSDLRRSRGKKKEADTWRGREVHRRLIKWKNEIINSRKYEKLYKKGNGIVLYYVAQQ